MSGQQPPSMRLCPALQRNNPRSSCGDKARFFSKAHAAIMSRPMTRAAPLINLVLLLLSVWTGYASLNPDMLHGTNPDKFLALALLVVMPVFALGAVSISGAGHSTFSL